MGIQNVSLVYARWVHLPDRAFRVLAFMALRTIDEDDPPLYWGGRESLAYALGRMTPVEPAASDSSPRAELNRKARAADFEAVKVALRPLFLAGVACIQTPSAPGRNAVYSLNLLAATGKAEPGEQGRLSLPPRREPPTGVPKVQDQEGTNLGQQPALVPTSPAAVEITPEKANEILKRLGPDEYGRLMERAKTEFGPLDIMLNAARIAVTEKPRLEIVKGEMA